MTKRERYLRALRCQKTDELVWAPNFDYWLRVNQAEGTLPPKHQGMSRNDIVRAIGGTIWHRVAGFTTVYDPAVRHSHRQQDGNYIDEISTPLGALRQVHCRTEGPHRSPALREHFVKSVEDLRVMQYVVEATHYQADYEPVRQALAETGEDGIVLHQGLCVPFIQFAKTDVGYLNAFYMWTDHRAEVDALIAAYERSFLEACTILAGSPADMIATGDNMDGQMISPEIFRRYAIPFYQQMRGITEPRGKILAAHWCGRTGNLLPLASQTGLRQIEAVVTRPMADLAISDALERVGDAVSLQGGVPSVLVCREGCSDEQFDQYIKQTILPLRGRAGFILGMGDNVPPNAVFSRVERLAGLIRA